MKLINSTMTIRIYIILIFSTSLLACSNDPLSISDSSWECEALQSGKECVVEFIIENKSPFIVKANITIQANDRVSLGKGAISNRIVFKKQYHESLSAFEIKKIKKTVNIERKFKHIVISAWKNKAQKNSHYQ